MKQVIVITGASSGFGELTAHELAKAGHVVYASMRETAGRNVPQVEGAKKFAAENKVDLRTIELDVASQESVDSAIQRIVSQNGRLDVVIHNAGHMVFGPAEAFTPEQLAELYESQSKPELAKKIYAQLKDKDPKGPAGMTAAQKLNPAPAGPGGQ